MVIVDCGSGYTRASRFHRSPTNRVHATATRCNIRALHHVMSCPCESSEWLRQLAELVDEVDAGATEVVLGATGGVRDLVSSGGITPEELTRFRELLATSADLPFTARLHILGGDDEARYEFLSAKYCATQCDYFSPTGDIVGSSDLNLGLLSSGGMSSQLFAKGCSLSVPTEIKKANRLGLEHGMEKGLAQVRQHASSVIEHIVPEKFGGRNVLYVAIEMFGGVGQKAGISGSTVGALSVGDAIERLSDFTAKAIADDCTPECERTWRTYSDVYTGTVATLMLRRLHPEAKVLFLREFELEGNVLKPSWSLGYAIANLFQDQREMQTRASKEIAPVEVRFP